TRSPIGSRGLLTRLSGPVPAVPGRAHPEIPEVLHPLLPSEMPAFLSAAGAPQGWLCGRNRAPTARRRATAMDRRPRVGRADPPRQEAATTPPGAVPPASRRCAGLAHLR